MKNLLITGSIAYDQIMSYNGLFEDSFISAGLSNINVSFLAERAIVRFGGCAGNIAYSLGLFGQKPFLFGVLGVDCEEYLNWLEKSAISCENIFIDKNSKTSCAYILTDKKQNQITFFAPGAMLNKELGMTFICAGSCDGSLAIISPNLPARMISLAKSAIEKNIDYIFDPGQELTALTAEQVLFLIENCFGMILNEYELGLVLNKTGLSKSALVKKCDFIVVTLAGRGSRLLSKGTDCIIPPLKADEIIDPTGCGDAFRAGFLFAFSKYGDLKKACAYGNIAGSLSLCSSGPQGHFFSESSVDKIYGDCC